MVAFKISALILKCFIEAYHCPGQYFFFFSVEKVHIAVAKMKIEFSFFLHCHRQKGCNVPAAVNFHAAKTRRITRQYLSSPRGAPICSMVLTLLFMHFLLHWFFLSWNVTVAMRSGGSLACLQVWFVIAIAASAVVRLLTLYWEGIIWRAEVRLACLRVKWKNTLR